MRKHPKPIDTMQRQGQRQYARPAGRRKRRLDAVQWTLLAVALVSAALIAGRLLRYRGAQDEYAAYQRLAAETPASAAQYDAPPPPTCEPTTGPTAAQGILAAAPLPTQPRNPLVQTLQRENADTVGWIEIPGTGIAYPVVQGKDNDYYTTHTFARKKSPSGAIFMDSYNQRDLSDFNTVIYGHNMKDGSMFAMLDAYAEQAYLDKHLDIEILTLERTCRYRVFAVYVAKGVDDFDFRAQTACTESGKREFILAARKRATNYSKASVATTDRLLTLVTCTDGREPWYFVVHAVLVEEAGEASILASAR